MKVAPGDVTEPLGLPADSKPAVSSVVHAPAVAPYVARYPQLRPLPTVGRDLPLQAGMCFAFEPNCGFGRHLANIGGTVIVGENGGIALNRNSTRLMLADG